MKNNLELSKHDLWPAARHAVPKNMNDKASAA